MGPLIRDGNAWHVERLRVDIIVEGQFEHEAEGTLGDVCCIKRALGEGRARNAWVVSALQDRLRALRGQAERQDQCPRCSDLRHEEIAQSIPQEPLRVRMACLR